jgi:hypothetical protein
MRQWKEIQEVLRQASGSLSFARRCSAAHRTLQFHKSSQPFIRTDNEALIVAAMRIGNEDRSPTRVYR